MIYLKVSENVCMLGAEAVTTCFASQAASFYDEGIKKNWCPVMTSASTMMKTISKSSVRYAYQIAKQMVCNIFLFFLNNPSELTFWIALVHVRSSSYRA